MLLGQNDNCPEVSITDINDNDAIYINCNSQDGCVDLVANYPQTGTPTSYTVEAIDYNPQFPFSGLTYPISVNIDDVWSDPKVILPFNFCFYNQEYSEAVVSSNGAISFDMSNINDNGTNSAGGGVAEAADECAWEFNLGIPNPSFPISSDPKKILNAIYGVFHDIDPSEGGQIGWQVFGEYPCRTLVVSYYQVPLFDCLDVNSTFQMVLYESTNIIEVYIENKATCNDWNNGNSVIGIQNANGTEGLTPPDRNTSSWETTNEAWRFSPSGASNTQITWYDVTGGNIILSNENQITVCPTSENVYRAEVIYSLCDGSTITTSDTTTVSFTDTIISQPPINHVECDSDDVQDGFTSMDLTIFDNTLITELNSINPYTISYHLTMQNALDNVLPIGSPTTFTNSTNPQAIFGRIEDLSINCILIKEIDINVTTGPTTFGAEVTSAAFASVHQITATAVGVDTYIFSLDFGSFQSIGIFDNVTPGLHTVTITDINFCFEENIELVVLDYPRFFTPNGDGYNDTWKIKSIEELAFVNITIFDRFGKEIIQLDLDSNGWDGTYNNNPLPASDYWFKIIYSEKVPKGVEREFIAHFSLKR